MREELRAAVHACTMHWTRYESVLDLSEHIWTQSFKNREGFNLKVDYNTGLPLATILFDLLNTCALNTYPVFPQKRPTGIILFHGL